MKIVRIAMLILLSCLIGWKVGVHTGIAIANKKFSKVKLDTMPQKKEFLRRFSPKEIKSAKYHLNSSTN